MTSPAIISARPARARLPVWLLPALAGVAMLAYVLVFGGYLVTVLGLAAIYGLFCVGLNFFMGYTGQASFGQNAFAALGGYGTAILTVAQGWGPLPALLVSMAISGVVALVVGYPTLRLRGHYLAMATFALGLIVYDLAIQWSDLTQGYMGYAGIPPLGLFGYALASERAQLVALVVILLFGVWLSYRMKASRFGRALLAIAGSEAASGALGINVARTKLIAFVIAAMYASAAGSLFAHFIGFISPEVFGLSMITLSFTMLYLGGVGTLWGPVIGAVLASFLPELFRNLAEFQDLAYGAVLILILIFVPGGVVSLRLRHFRRGTPSGGPP